MEGTNIDNVLEETHAVTNMIQESSCSKAQQTDGERQKSSQGSGSKQEHSLDKNETPFRFKFCKNPSCKLWHPPVCLNHKSEKLYIVDMSKQKESPTNSRINVAKKDQLLCKKESAQTRCVSDLSYPRKPLQHE